MTTASARPWLLRPADTAHRPPRVPAGVEYHRVLAGPRRRILRGVLAIFLVLLGLVVFSVAMNALSARADAMLGNDPTAYTPLRHAGAMVGLALLTPWSMLLQRVLYGLPAASLHSVGSRFRFDVMGKALIVFGPLFLAANTASYLLPVESVPWSQAELVAMFLATLLLTPLQAAGEEYGVRGLAFRVLGSWTRNPTAGLVLAIAVTSVGFTLMHGSTDPYVIVWYMTLWTSLGVITWRTGGLEVAVVLHAVLNTFNFVAAFLLHIDFGSAIQGRAEVTGADFLLLPAGVVAAIAAAIWWHTRTSGPARTPADS